jgi:membrane protein YqaA with SNARE-associated domain
LPNPSGPDFILLIFAAADPGSAFLGAAFGVVGSILGNFVLYSIARKGGEIYLIRHTEGRKGRRFREWFSRYGLATVFVPALVPIPMPLKVFVISSGALRVNQVHFLGVLGAARAIRYFSLAWLGKTLGEESQAWIPAHRWQLIGGALALLAVLFLLVKLADRRRVKLTAS